MRYRYSTTSPFVRKVSVFLHHHGLWDQIELVPTLTTSMQVGPEREEDIPLGKIPALEVKPGFWLYDSRVICRYIDENSNQASLYPESEIKWEILRLEALADGMIDNLVPVIYENAFREDGLVWTDRHVILKRRTGKALAYAEEIFTMLGDDFNAASIALVSAVSWIDFRKQVVGLDPKDHAPKLLKWVKMMEDQYQAFDLTRPVA